VLVGARRVMAEQHSGSDALGGLLLGGGISVLYIGIAKQ
jgi:membrane-associated phospholipid phosphatase